MLVAVAILGVVACGNPTVKQSSVGEPTLDATAPAEATAGATVTPESTGVPPGTDTATPLRPTETPGLPSEVATETVTPSPEAATEAVPTIPARNLPLQFSPGSYLTLADLDARGVGTTFEQPFLGTRLTIPAIAVDAAIDVKIAEAGFITPFVEFDHVAGYEFRNYPGHGGVPGFGNMVIAGQYRHFDDTATPGPPAVFYRLAELAVGNEIHLATSDGRTFAYRVDFNKVTRPGDWTWDTLMSAVTLTTAYESITLFSGDASGGIRIVWARAYP